MKKWSFLFLLAFIILSSSCATIMLSTTQELSISSSPSEALVTNNGLQLGKTPLIADLKRKGNHRIKIELEGYQPFEVMLTRKTSGWIWGNLLFGGVPGLIIDVITGAMYILQPEQIQAELRNTGTDITLDKNQIFIAVTLKANPLWHKIGTLKKIDNPY